MYSIFRERKINENKTKRGADARQNMSKCVLPYITSELLDNSKIIKIIME